MAAEAEQLMFTVMAILGIGTFFYHHLSRLNVPYTVIMFVMGMILGFAGLQLPDDAKDYFDLLAQIPPNLLFHIFLPILIFEGAYGMKTHAFREVVPQAMLLAGPGLIINTSMVGVALKFLYPDWNWYTALLLGSILSATDPVAVVALLKDLGVDKRITALVDGEAIMNDGTAIIVFTIFLDAAARGEIKASWYALIVQALQLVFGGVVWGTFCGWAQTFFLRRTSDHLVQTCITISIAFISFYVADVWLLTSGVLTLCFEGVYLAANFPSMFPGKEGSMFNSVWHYVVHFANTIVFALVGVIIAQDAAGSLTFMDLWYILFLYIVVVIGRFVMLYMMSPFLNKFSYKLGRKEIMLLVHGGLRGAVAATLALHVVRDKGMPQDTGIDFLVLTCGIVLLTITVNATTSDHVVAKLGLKVKEGNRILQMAYGHNYVLNQADRALRRIKSSKFVRTANWAMVEPLIAKVENPYATMNEKAETEDLMFRVLLMRAFKTSVWRQKDAHHIGEDACRILTRVTADCMRVGSLITTANLARHMQYSFAVPIFARIGVNAMVNYLKSEQDKANFGVLLAYAEALDDVEESLLVYVNTTSHLKEAHDWLSKERLAIEEKISAYTADKPDTARAVITTKAAEMMIAGAEEAVHELHHHRGFSVPATEALEKALHNARHYIDHFPSEMDKPNAEEIWRLSKIGQAPVSIIQAVARESAERIFEAGEELKLHEHHNEIVVISSGSVAILGRDDVTYGCGSILGLPRSFTQRKQTSKFHAQSRVRLFVIPAQKMMGLADDSAQLHQLLQIEAAVDVTERLMNKMHQFSTWNFDNLTDMVREGRVLTAPRDNYIYPAAANELVILLKGSDASGFVTDETEPFVVPHSATLSWNSGSVLFIVKARLSEDTLSAATISATALSVVAENSSNLIGDDVEMSGTPGTPSVPLKDLHSLASPVRTGPGFIFRPENNVTSSERQNAAQLEFLLQLEYLTTLSDSYKAYNDSRTRLLLSKGIDYVLDYLCRYCLRNFSSEEKMYEEAELSTAHAHHNEHVRFQAQVGQWMDRKYFDDLNHQEIIAGMESFIDKHFPIDHRDSMAAAKAGKKSREE